MKSRGFFMCTVHIVHSLARRSGCSRWSGIANDTRLIFPSGSEPTNVRHLVLGPEISYSRRQSSHVRGQSFLNAVVVGEHHNQASTLDW